MSNLKQAPLQMKVKQKLQQPVSLQVFCNGHNLDKWLIVLLKDLELAVTTQDHPYSLLPKSNVVAPPDLYTYSLLMQLVHQNRWYPISRNIKSIAIVSKSQLRADY